MTPSPPSFETAAASSGPAATFMPARKIGLRRPKSSCGARASGCQLGQLREWRQLPDTPKTEQLQETESSAEVPGGRVRTVIGVLMVSLDMLYEGWEVQL